MDNKEGTILYSISEASERLGLTYRTLHYYEQKLGVHISRDGAGNRIYTEENILVLEKVLELKKKGVSLDGIKAMLEENGLLEASENNKLIVMDENTLQLRDYFISEFRQMLIEERQELAQEFKQQMDVVIQEIKEQSKNEIEILTQHNSELKEEIEKIVRSSEDHYKKIDDKLTAWRENKEDKPKSWLGKLFIK
jgi:DNA-binding transcriptional MerR regulator